jgi:hypothetical protein
MNWEYPGSGRQLMRETRDMAKKLLIMYHCHSNRIGVVSAQNRSGIY